MNEEYRNRIHRKLTSHEKQFTYLPYHIVRNATNIADLILPTVAKGQLKWLDTAIDQIYNQMATKCGRWLDVLADLRFVEPIPSDNELVSDESNECDYVPKPSTSTDTPTDVKNDTAASPSNPLTRESHNTEVNFIKQNSCTENVSCQMNENDVFLDRISPRRR